MLEEVIGNQSDIEQEKEIIDSDPTDWYVPMTGDSLNALFLNEFNVLIPESGSSTVHFDLLLFIC